MPDANYTKIAWPKISHDDAASSAITAGLPPGDAWRSAKAKLQRRDRRGRFAEMGGGFSFKFRLKNGDVARASGKIVGMSGQEDVDVEVAGSSSLPDGVYSVPASKGDAVKAVIGKNALENVRRENVDVADDDTVIENIDSMRRTGAEDAEKPKKRVFKRSKDAAARGAKTDPVDAQLVAPEDDGTLAVRRTRPGVTVKDPVTGEDVALNAAEDASKYVADGGALVDVPDEFLMTSIVQNLTRKGDPVERRFKAIGKGKGINGMMMFRDNVTGALLGYKYLGGISTWWESAGFDMKFAYGNNSEDLPKYDYFKEALNEIFSEKISEMLGNEAMPMRIVDSRGGDDAGVSLVTELAQNRYGTVLSPFSADVTNSSAEVIDVDLASYARMRLLDLIIGNTDRNEGNYLLSKRDDGTNEIVPIDHSLAFKPEEAGDRLAWQDVPANMSYFNGQIKYDPDMMEELIDIVGDLQAVLASVDLKSLSALFESAIQLISELRPGILTPELIEDERINMLNTAIERIVTALEMSPRQLATALIGKR